MNQLAQHFLDAYASGREAEGGWLFGKALQQARLDFSAAGLGRLDQLLAAIRERVRPSRELLEYTPEGRKLCALIAFHLVEIVRRRSLAHLAWHDRQSALAQLPPGTALPDVADTALIALFDDQGAAFMPLSWVHAQLLGVERQERAADYVGSMVSHIERDVPGAWFAGAEAMGKMASWQMMMAADGGTVMPLMLSSTQPDTWVTLVPPMAGTDVNAALDAGGRKLDDNPDGAVWQLLSYDGQTVVDGKQTDAIMVLLQTYGNAQLGLKIAFPYRAGNWMRKFQIMGPSLMNANVDGQAVSMLNGALERGIQSINWAFGTTWNELRKD